MLIHYWEMVQEGEFNSVGENFVKLCRNPCPPFMTLLTIQGCFISTGGGGVSCPCATVCILSAVEVIHCVSLDQMARSKVIILNTLDNIIVDWVLALFKNVYIFCELI